MIVCQQLQIAMVLLPSYNLCSDLKEAENLSKLHFQIQESDKILCELGTILKDFEDDLGTVSADIETLQFHSRGLNMRLQNRSVRIKYLLSYK